jgi:hypothetical protein
MKTSNAAVLATAERKQELSPSSATQASRFHIHPKLSRFCEWATRDLTRACLHVRSPGRWGFVLRPVLQTPRRPREETPDVPDAGRRMTAARRRTDFSLRADLAAGGGTPGGGTDAPSSRARGAGPYPDPVVLHPSKC